MLNRYLRITCSPESMIELSNKFRQNFYFAITFLDQPTVHYFILLDEGQVTLAKWFAETKGCEIKSIEKNEIADIDPTRRKHTFRGSLNLSPWPGIGLSV